MVALSKFQVLSTHGSLFFLELSLNAMRFPKSKLFETLMLNRTLLVLEAYTHK